jgi:hypothetical protein
MSRENRCNRSQDPRRVFAAFRHSRMYERPFRRTESDFIPLTSAHSSRALRSPGSDAPGDSTCTQHVRPAVTSARAPSPSVSVLAKEHAAGLSSRSTSSSSPILRPSKVTALLCGVDAPGDRCLRPACRAASRSTSRSVSGSVAAKLPLRAVGAVEHEFRRLVVREISKGRQAPGSRSFAPTRRLMPGTPNRAPAALIRYPREPPPTPDRAHPR